MPLPLGLSFYRRLSPASARKPRTLRAGTIQFANPGAGGNLVGNSIIFAVTRGSGSTGAVSVTCSTVDGTGKASVDYIATTNTLSWADGDTANKTFTVPFLNRGLTDGTTVSFSVQLSNPAGGAVLGSASTDIDTIAYPTIAAQPTIQITSPPSDLTLVTGTPVTLAASVTDPSNILSLVQFYVNDLPAGQSVTEGPFTLDTTAPAPGTYVLKAVATDNQGRESVSTRTVTVVAADPADPAPATSLLTDLGGHQLAGGASVVLAATADSFSSDGTPLGEVDFYADSTLIASFDGNGNLLSGQAGVAPAVNGQRLAAVRRTSADSSPPAAKGSVFAATWTLPNLTKLINLITVATTASGRSQVSSPTSVQAVASTPGGNRPPEAVFASTGDGSRVHTGVPITVPVMVSDPDAASGSALTGGQGRRRSDVTFPSGLISKMEVYLNQVKLATITQPPYTASFTPPAEGTYVIEAIVTDGSGLSGVATPLIVDAVSATPGVSVSLAGAVNGKSADVAAGDKAKVVVTRVNDDFTEPLTVGYKLKGSAVAGVDYKTLSSTVTIPAGAKSTKIKVSTLNNAASSGSAVLKLKLVPSADDIYEVTGNAGVKIGILDQ